MALSRSQEHTLDDTCNVWRRAAPGKGAHNAPSGAAYALVASAVPCHFETGKGMSVPKDVGRTDYDIVLTSDQVHFGVDADVADGDVLKNTTASDPRNGLFYTVQGEPQLIGNLGRRYPGSKTVTAARAQSAPAGVS